MLTAQLIVCEPQRRWIMPLRHRLSGQTSPGEEMPLCETRTLAECDRLLRDWPASFVAIGVARANFREVLGWLATLGARHPEARAVALLDRGQDELRWPLCEAGALHVVQSPRKLAIVVNMARRQLARAPQRQMSDNDRILATLPWSGQS